MNTHSIAAAGLAALALSLVSSAAEAGGACYRKVATPALYRDVAEHVLVRPARYIAHRIPAVTEAVAEQVLVQPGGQVWSVRYDAYGQEIGCWVHTPPVYATRYHYVVVQPASVEYETIPAEYEDVTHHVLVQPATLGWQPIGGCYE
jgi:hypothetical protein